MELFSCSGQIKFFLVQWKTKEGINTVLRFSKKNYIESFEKFERMIIIVVESN